MEGGHVINRQGTHSPCLLRTQFFPEGTLLDLNQHLVHSPGRTKGTRST